MEKLICPYCGSELTKNTFWYETKEEISHKCCGAIIKFKKSTIIEEKFVCERCKNKVKLLNEKGLCPRCDESLYGVKDEN